jgi:hypothetical protein
LAHSPLLWLPKGCYNPFISKHLLNERYPRLSSSKLVPLLKKDARHDELQRQAKTNRSYSSVFSTRIRYRDRNV